MLALAVCSLLIVVALAGCCTCRVEDHPNVVLIVKQPDPMVPDQNNPVGLPVGFEEKLEDGDTIRLMNRFGSKVTVTFPAGVIAETSPIEIARCKDQDVTIQFVGDPPDSFDIEIDGGPGHGGATIIVDPGGP